MMIPRQKMPQIPANKIHEFKEFLISHNVITDFQQLRVGSLKPIQRDVNKEKIQTLMSPESEDALVQPLVVSEDGFIMDGLHRAIAQAALDPNGVVMCLVAKAPIRDLIQLGHDFEGS